MNRIKLVFTLSAICALCIKSTFSQNKVLPVNLEAVMKIAGANNLSVQEYKLKHQLAIADVSKEKDWWLPGIYLGTSTHFLNGAAMNTDGAIFHPVNSNNLWTGLGLSVEWDFSKGIYGVLASKQKEQAMKHYASAEKNQSILKAISAYFELYSEELKYAAFQELVMQSDTLMQQIKIQVDAGLRYQSEYLLAQSNHSHLKILLLKTRTQWLKRSAELKELLNMKENVLLSSSDSTMVPIKLIENKIDSVQLNLAEKRPEFFAIQSDMRSVQLQRKSRNTGLLIPHVRLGFENGLFGKLQTSYFYTNQFNVSILWKIPAGRFIYNGEIKQFDAKILLKQNELEQFKIKVQKEISASSAEINSTEEQIEISKNALKLSAEALNQSLERQKLGTAKPFEVFQAQQYLIQAQLDYLESVKTYNIKQYELSVSLGNNL